MAIYCKECGAMIADGETVCRRCQTPVEGQAVPPQQVNQQQLFQQPVQPCEAASVQVAAKQPQGLFDSLPSYYREEFTKIYNSNGKYHGKFNAAALLLWGPLYLMKLGDGKGICYFILWLISILAICGGIGIVSTIGAGVLFGICFNSDYYKCYMKKRCDDEPGDT